MRVYLFTKLFYLLLFLLMCGTLLCGHVCASGVEVQAPAPENTIDLFTKEKVKGVKTPNGDAGASDVDVRDFYSPIIVSAGGFIVALAGINRNDNQEKKINILTNYTEINKLLDDGNVAKMNENWKTLFAVYDKAIQNTENAEKVVNGLLAVAKDDKLYFLSVSYIKKTTGNSPDFDFLFYCVDGRKAKNPTEFKWSESKLTVSGAVGELKDKFQAEEKKDFSLSGSAFLVEENMVFALVFKNVEKKIIALMQFKKNEGEPELKYTENIADNCRPFFFPWKTKIMMISADCETSTNNKIKELTDNWQKWNESSKAFSGHYEFLKNKQTFVTIRNKTKEILLFTDHLQPATKVNLWMSDGIRLKNIGEIADGADKVSPVNFLFADGKLFSLNQKLEGDSSSEIESVKLTYLEQQSKNIISTINAWSTTDDKILKFCTGEDALKILCNTNGLVGFLSNNAKGNTEWKDEYLNVNAVFNLQNSNTATELGNGFTFRGEGAGAQWSVIKQSKDQPYNFIDPGFTLVATVSVGKDTKGKQISILGVSSTDNVKVGLWCTTDGKWGVSKKDGQISNQLSDPNCVPDKTYYVALTLNNNKDIYVYVNGRQLSKLNSKDTQITQSQNTAYFYFGADSNTQAKTDVTITDVLLYNWPFEEEKITQLKPKENTVVVTHQTTQTESSETATPGDSTTHTDKPASTSHTKDKEEETQPSSPPPTTEDSAARVGVVGVLCFMLFVVFTLLGRYVY